MSAVSCQCVNLWLNFPLSDLSLVRGGKPAGDRPEKGEEDEEEEQQEVVSEFNSLFKRLMKKSRTPTEPPPPPLGKAARAPEAELAPEEEGLLDEGLVRARTVEDLEALVHDGTVEESGECASHAAAMSPASEPQSTHKKKKVIDPREVLTKNAAVIKVPLAPTLMEGEEEEEEEEGEEEGEEKEIVILFIFLRLFLLID